MNRAHSGDGTRVGSDLKHRYDGYYDGVREWRRLGSASNERGPSRPLCAGKAVEFTPRRVASRGFLGHQPARPCIESAGLRPLCWRVSDYSLAVETFQAGLAKGIARQIIRRSALRLAPSLAQKLFTYHTAVLADAS
jgi:hypothetical protein